MVYAAILRPPAHGARLKSLDTAAAEKIAGVKIVRDGDLIAVTHAYPDVAERALGKVQADYDLPQTGVDHITIFDDLLKKAPAPVVAAEAGDLAAGAKSAAAVIEETYLNSYVAHAPMEPHTALAAVEAQKATVWASTQTPFGTQGLVARALGFPAENVRVITPFVGGGFGGKGASPQAVEAARLSRLAGKPVMVAWSRKEEFFYDTFRPAAVVKIRSGIDGAGRMAFWDYRVYFAGRRGCENFYEIPHHRESVYGEWQIGPGTHPFAVGPWRLAANIYARNLHINLWPRARKDPLEYRRPSERQAHAPRPRGRREALRLDAHSPGAERPGLRAVLRHRCGDLRGHHGRGRGR
jgi:isoquinoline 1-oxidoreductase